MKTDITKMKQLLILLLILTIISCKNKTQDTVSTTSKSTDTLMVEPFQNNPKSNSKNKIGIDFERKYEKVHIDEKITDQPYSLKWLHFSDCMNNGGTSQLFIDFSPSEKGTKGQIVRFLHDPDEFSVIADSFEEYLKNRQQW